MPGKPPDAQELPDIDFHKLGIGGDMSRALGLAGCACLFVVVLTHVAERFHLLTSMGWGLPDSPGHYLDMFSAIAGVVFLLAAVVLRWISN